MKAQTTKETLILPFSHKQRDCCFQTIDITPKHARIFHQLGRNSLPLLSQMCTREVTGTGIWAPSSWSLVDMHKATNLGVQLFLGTSAKNLYTTPPDARLCFLVGKNTRTEARSPSHAQGFLLAPLRSTSSGYVQDIRTRVLSSSFPLIFLEETHEANKQEERHSTLEGMDGARKHGGKIRQSVTFDAIVHRNLHRTKLEHSCQEDNYSMHSGNQMDWRQTEANPISFDSSCRALPTTQLDPIRTLFVNSSSRPSAEVDRAQADNRTCLFHSTYIRLFQATSKPIRPSSWEVEHLRPNP
ncbi:hypothetical protein M5K25_001844 [Dendrobium thyrsiflorum]|uniref:Uncharacterized protein n=1 Tax=Dendrobium thyrsiflorum TaxID=117978 RepID=A0ABD0VRH2_DENTH